MGWILISAYSTAVLGGAALILWRERASRRRWVNRHPWLRPLVTLPPSDEDEVLGQASMYRGMMARKK